VELAPDSEDAQMAMGIYLYRVEKDYQGAVEWFGRASGTLLGDYDYHRYRSVAERRMGRWRASAASREAALALSPIEASAWSEAGLTYLCMRRYNEAERAFQEALRLDPDAGAGSLLFRLALLTWFRDGTMDGWVPYLERFPTSFTAWEVAMTEGRYGDAQEIVARLPDVLSSQYHWTPKPLYEAETLSASGDSESARAKYQEAAGILEPLVERTPDDERYRASLAWVYAGLGRRDDAVREGRRAAEIMSRDRDALGGPMFLFNLAAVHAGLGEVEEAVEVLEDLFSAPARFAPHMIEDHFLFRPIRDDPRFQALIDLERDRVF
jgi:tetratricopeptide (TPR) repeat protein